MPNQPKDRYPAPIAESKKIVDCLLGDEINWNGLPENIRQKKNDFDPTQVFEALNRQQHQVLKLLARFLEQFIFVRLQHKKDLLWTASEWLQILLNLAKVSVNEEGRLIENCWNSELPLSGDEPSLIVAGRNESAAWISALFSPNNDPASIAQYSMDHFRKLDGSHLCANKFCDNLFHLMLENSAQIKHRIGCVCGCASLCPHKKKPCIYQRDGLYLPCRSDPTKRRCNCERDCFRVVKKPA